MTIKEANWLINEINKNHKHDNIFWHLESSYGSGLYLKLDLATVKSKTITGEDSVSKIHLCGIRTVEEIVSFFMSNTSRKSGLFSIRKNYVKVYRNIWGKNVLKLVIDHNVSKVFFKDIIESAPTETKTL